MGIHIRQTKLAKNRIRLSLDIYHEGKSNFEKLDLFLYDKPTTKSEREHNKRTSQLAETIRAKRILEMQEGRYNVQTGFKG